MQARPWLWRSIRRTVIGWLHTFLDGGLDIGPGCWLKNYSKVWHAWIIRYKIDSLTCVYAYINTHAYTQADRRGDRFQGGQIDTYACLLQRAREERGMDPFRTLHVCSVLCVWRICHDVGNCDKFKTENFPSKNLGARFWICFLFWFSFCIASV